MTPPRNFTGDDAIPGPDPPVNDSIDRRAGIAVDSPRGKTPFGKVGLLPFEVDLLLLLTLSLESEGDLLLLPFL